MFRQLLDGLPAVDFLENFDHSGDEEQRTDNAQKEPPERKDRGNQTDAENKRNATERLIANASLRASSPVSQQ